MHGERWGWELDDTVLYMMIVAEAALCAEGDDWNNRRIGERRLRCPSGPRIGRAHGGCS